MEWVHDRNNELAQTFTRSNSHLDLLSLFNKFCVIDTFDVPKEIDFDFYAVDRCLNDRSLRGMVIGVWNVQLAIQGVSKLFRGLSIPEIVQIFGGIRSICAEGVDIAVSLRPKVEGLASNDKGFVAKL